MLNNSFHAKRANEQCLYILVASAALTTFLLAAEILATASIPPRIPDPFHPMLALVGEFTAYTAALYLLTWCWRLWEGSPLQALCFGFWLKLRAHYPVPPHLIESSSSSTFGYVYLVKGVKTGFYKIGHSRNPLNRVETFRVKLPFDVEIEHLIKCENRLVAEALLHRCFAHRRVPGTEWFNLTLDDVLLIKAINHL